MEPADRLGDAVGASCSITRLLIQASSKYTVNLGNSVIDKIVANILMQT